MYTEFVDVFEQKQITAALETTDYFVFPLRRVAFNKYNFRRKN